jgi:hypothetical protein
LAEREGFINGKKPKNFLPLRLCAIARAILHLSPANRKLIPEYIKDYVSLNHFAA